MDKGFFDIFKQPINVGDMVLLSACTSYITKSCYGLVVDNGEILMMSYFASVVTDEEYPMNILNYDFYNYIMLKNGLYCDVFKITNPDEKEKLIYDKLLYAYKKMKAGIDSYKNNIRNLEIGTVLCQKYGYQVQVYLGRIKSVEYIKSSTSDKFEANLKRDIDFIKNKFLVDNYYMYPVVKYKYSPIDLQGVLEEDILDRLGRNSYSYKSLGAVKNKKKDLYVVGKYDVSKIFTIDKKLVLKDVIENGDKLVVEVY